jgi:tRNA-dihydrouridine synthase B
MAGQTNQAFRRLCRELGGVGLVTTELISSTALENRGTRSRSLIYYDWHESEFPLSVQLYGADPAVMAEAARIVVDLGARMIDINMGCWVPKVIKKGGGAALLGDICSATRVVEAVVKAVDVPVTVKVRSGVDPEHITAVPFARAAQECGAAAIAVHARTASQGFTGEPDWNVIKAVVENVTIPVIGNGDLLTLDDALRMQRETGCAAWMVGRAALGAPWLFAQWTGLLPPGDPPLAQRAAVALRHLRLTRECSQLSEGGAVRELRGQLSRYRLDPSGSTEVRDRLVRIATYSEGEQILEHVASLTIRQH